MQTRLALAVVSTLAFGGIALGDDAPSKQEEQVDCQLVLVTDCLSEVDLTDPVQSLVRLDVGVRVELELRICVAFEGHLFVSLTQATGCITGDFDCDGHVSGPDLTILLGNWGSCVSCDGDLDDNGEVGPSDLAMFLGEWTG